MSKCGTTRTRYTIIPTRRPETNEHICARCARQGDTCCRKAQVFVTLGDVARIAAACPGEDFAEYAAPADSGYAQNIALDASWARTFGDGGRRRVLKHRAGGDCHFLGPGGCRLPLETRPLVCRLYPFDYNETAVKGVFGHLCPAPENGNGPLLLALLGMNREASEKWRRMLYAEIVGEYPGAQGLRT